MKERFILLVEDNPDDEELTLIGLKKSGLLNEIKVVRDGEEALHFIFAEGKYKGRDSSRLPAASSTRSWLNHLHLSLLQN
jgi:two-component system, response regulator